MRNKFIIIAIIISVIIFSFSCMQKDKNKKDYRSVKVKKDVMEVIINATGVIKATTQIDIKSEIGGEVIKLPFEEGDHVKKGALIAVIDDTQLQQKKSQAEADYRSSMAQLEQAQASLVLEEAVTSVTISQKEKELEKAELSYNQALTELNEQKELAKQQIDQAKASLETSKKQLDKVLAGSREQEIAEQLETVRQAEVTMENARKELERQNELYEKEFVALKDVDNAEKDYLVAQSQYQSAQEQYNMLLEGNRQEEIDISRAQVKESEKNLELKKTQSAQDIASKERALEIALNGVLQARLALQEAIDQEMQVNVKEGQVLSNQAQLDKAEASSNEAEDQLSKTKILSPSDGVIIKRDVEIGDVVASQTMSSASGTTLMTIADLSELYAVADIDESDLGKLKENLKVTITAAAYQDLVIPGIISYIASQAQQVEQIPTFMIKIKVMLDDIKEKDLPAGRSRYEILYPGMSVDADIHVEHKENVLQLPIEAVWQKDGKSYVTLVKEGDKFEDVEVSTGIKNNIMVEITSGVSEGEEVKVPEIEEDEEESGGGGR